MYGRGWRTALLRGGAGPPTRHIAPPRPRGPCLVVYVAAGVDEWMPLLPDRPRPGLAGAGGGLLRHIQGATSFRDPPFFRRLLVCVIYPCCPQGAPHPPPPMGGPAFTTVLGSSTRCDHCIAICSVGPPAGRRWARQPPPPPRAWGSPE